MRLGMLLSFHIVAFFVPSMPVASGAIRPSLPRIIHVPRTSLRPSATPLAFKSSSWVRRNTNTVSSPSKNSKKNKSLAQSSTQDVSIIDKIKQSVGNFLFGNLVDSIFAKADTDNDGRISQSEVNTLILRMYVKINRAAPIPPPSRSKVDALFANADADGSGRLTKEEFSHLALLLASRASTRLVAHKIVSFVVAPVLAIKTVERLSGKHLAETDMVQKVVPKNMQSKIADANLWKTLLTVVFVKSLGNVVISTVTVILDAMHLRGEDEDKD